MDQTANDQTQAFDPNRTALGDPNRTVLGGGQVADPNRTTAWSPPETGLAVSVTPSRIATLANGPAREQFLIEIAAPSDPGLPGVSAPGARTALNLCLVIDRSGSMEGPPLEYAKLACSHVVDMLTPNDVLSIVVFEETVEVLMAPQRVTNREAVRAGIALIQPGNTTNLFDGMHLAAMQLGQNAEAGRASRMMVLSDGDPTAGIKDFASLVAQAGEMRAKGVTCTFLGFGPDYNEELLAAMAKKSGGNYYYIAQPHLIPEVFRAELDKLVSVSAMELRLTLSLARWVNLRGVSGQSVPPDSREFTIELPDLERGATLGQVVDLEFPNHPLGHYRVAGGRLTYVEAVGAQGSQNVDLVMEFTADAGRYSVPPDPRVASAMEVSAASRAVERTVMGLKTGQMTAAMALGDLQKTQALLVSQGRVQDAQEVTMAIQAIQRGDTGGAEKTLMGTMVNLDQGKSK